MCLNIWLRQPDKAERLKVKTSNSHFGENLFKSPASLYRNDI
ncbi:hypothetical protein L1F28_30545 [Arthrospira platensis NCB002]|nr:hypothetical protein [Arthrospira platensis NCB002]